MRALTAPLLLACALLSVGCTTPAVFDEDGWSIERRFDNGTPELLSTSEINAGTPAAPAAFQTTPVRSRERGRLRIAITADSSIAGEWMPGASLFDPQLDRALDWLAKLGASESRGIELRLALMPASGSRRQQRAHAADKTLVIDLLVPVPTAPRSRSAALDAALATGLHEAAHALRPISAKDRGDDEYRASLVAACFRIEGAQRGDRIGFGAAKAQSRRDFTRAHSASASQAVNRDLAAALGAASLDGADRAGIATLRGFCTQRLAQPPR